MLDRLGVFISCAIPSLLFYILTRQPDAKPSNVILSAIVVLQLVIPLAFNGGGEMLDMAVVAFFSCYASFGMVRYMADDNEHVEPFYKVLGRWNDRKKEGERHPQVRHNKEVSAIRKDAIGWLSHALLIVIISVPVMAFLDGFLRMCIEPLEIPYMTLLLTAPHHIPLKTLIYYTIAGTAFLMHVVFVPSFIQLGYSIELLIRSVMGSQYTLRKRYDVVHTYVHSPPLFDRPWLSTSIHELWSRRWHQILRWAFEDIVYTPICQAFPHLGRILGTMAVFAISGFLHDYLLMAMFGYQEYMNQPGIAGFQTLFFLLQGVATLISKRSSIGLPTWLARTLTYLYILYTAPLFIEPFLHIGLHRDAEMPGYPRFFDPHMDNVCPYGSRPFV
ncbi:predicted protein [Lichtheimia corymbifera JMRC:FSU:9682]|uniref:Wax synthase domain-containing protein n=1 Tax=Lichtheimia corymbifera JMRC:FSU:9682 TaxID=1263082 RepID=A0A068RL34_9FUNG|nr:predicted protein [Lichtheimia corymbifera JMRC:FSU:9682]